MFFEKDYEIPDQELGYMKFEQGENRFRILSEHPIVGYKWWIEDEDGNRKPIRRRMGEKIPVVEIQSDETPKHFWAMVVWNYKAERLQILEITQATIQRAIKANIDNPKWGDPHDYDITVTRKGESLDTEYLVTVDPKEEMSDEIKEVMPIANRIELDALYDGGDPFANLTALNKEDEQEILGSVDES